MSAILLRKLTRKSVLNFGKYEGYGVGQMIDLGHNAYLRWVYYNCSAITFDEEILRAIHIRKEREIPKPGVKRGEEIEVFNQVNTGLRKHIAKLKQNKRSRGRLAGIINTFPSRHELMMKNHGH